MTGDQAIAILSHPVYWALYGVVAFGVVSYVAIIIAFWWKRKRHARAALQETNDDE